MKFKKGDVVIWTGTRDPDWGIASLDLILSVYSPLTPYVIDNIIVNQRGEYYRLSNLYHIKGDFLSRVNVNEPL